MTLTVLFERREDLDARGQAERGRARRGVGRADVVVTRGSGGWPRAARGSGDPPSARTRAMGARAGRGGAGDWARDRVIGHCD